MTDRRALGERFKDWYDKQPPTDSKIDWLGLYWLIKELALLREEPAESILSLIARLEKIEQWANTPALPGMFSQAEYNVFADCKAHIKALLEQS